MYITGKLLKNNRIISIDQAKNEDENLNMTRQLEACLVDLCKSFNIPIPIWMKKHKGIRSFQKNCLYIRAIYRKSEL